MKNCYRFSYNISRNEILNWVGCFLTEKQDHIKHFKLVIIPENVDEYADADYNKELFNFIDIDKEYYENVDFKNYNDFKRWTAEKCYNKEYDFDDMLINYHKINRGSVIKGSKHQVIFISLRQNTKNELMDTIAHEAAHAAFHLYFGWTGWKEQSIIYDDFDVSMTSKNIFNRNEKIAQATGKIAKTIFDICKEHHSEYLE